jgi:adenosylcobinamide-GDP ribazoletransferase
MCVTFIEGFRASISFLTTIPVSKDAQDLNLAANYMSSFPIIGAMIGFVSGMLVWALDSFLPSLIVGMLGLAFILLLTGVHHTDGLLDFGDAVMLRGSPEDRIQVMHDQQTGAAGLSLGLLVLSTTAFSIAALDRSIVIQSLFASEAVAKFAMVLQAWAGKSARKGLNTPFVEGMHGRWRRLRLATALGLVLATSILALGIVGLVVTFAASLTAAVMLMISHKQFGGITGDVMGATNELTRLTSLLVVLVTAEWV